MTIAVFFGSKSPEHEVSIITAQLIISELWQTQHEVIAVYLDKSGKWFVQKNKNKNSDKTKQKAERNGLFSLRTFGDKSEFVKEFEKSWEEWQISTAKSVGKLVLTKKNWLGEDKIEIDLVFPALHGNCGEDGAIAGFCEIFGVPFVGCDLTSSAVSMDKILSKMLAESLGIRVAKYLSRSKLEIANWTTKPTQKEEFMNQIEQEIGYPNFVKPPKLGSSIGITKTLNRSELSDALDLCLYYDDEILVEKAIENLADLTCCVLENSQNPTLQITQKITQNENSQNLKNSKTDEIDLENNSENLDKKSETYLKNKTELEMQKNSQKDLQNNSQSEIQNGLENDFEDNFDQNLGDNLGENLDKNSQNNLTKNQEMEKPKMEKSQHPQTSEFPTLIASLVQESTYSKELFSFEEKYLTNSEKQLIIPAPINAQITREIQEYSKILFAKTGCSGIARFDFLFDQKSQKLYFSEINPLPGNLYKHLWLQSGVSFDKVVAILIKTAMEKSQNQKITSFESSILKIANSSKMNGKMGKTGN